MANDLLISPVALYSLTGIIPVATALAAGSLRTADSARAADSASIIDLSAEGRLLAALTTFRGDLESLTETAAPQSAVDILFPVTRNDTAIVITAADTPAPPADTPTLPADGLGSLTAAAQILVDAFNTLLDGLANAPAGQISGGSLAGQLDATLAALIATLQAGSGEASLSLADIGITTTRNAAGPLVLQLDPEQLAAAFAATPDSTRAILANAARAFGTLATGAETQLVDGATSIDSGPGLLGTAPPVAATDLPPTTVPAAGPDSLVPITTETTLLPAETRVDLLQQLAPLNGATTALTSVPAKPDTEQAITALLATVASAQPTTATATAAPTLAPTVAPAAAEAQAAEQRIVSANLALQTQLDDPHLRAVDNHADPAYAAVIAATHLNDFDTPWPANDPAALLKDSVDPVSALLRGQAIADYREAANEAVQRTLAGTDRTHHWA